MIFRFREDFYMTKNKTLILKIIVRFVAIVFMVFAVIFCYTFNGYCIGDNFLTTIGLKAWSNGMHGTHYTVFYSFGILLVSFILYAFTTYKKIITFLYFISGFSIIFILANVFF